MKMIITTLEKPTNTFGLLYFLRTRLSKSFVLKNLDMGSSCELLETGYTKTILHYNECRTSQDQRSFKKLLNDIENRSTFFEISF